MSTSEDIRLAILDRQEHLGISTYALAVAWDRARGQSTQNPSGTIGPYLRGEKDLGVALLLPLMQVLGLEVSITIAKKKKPK
jgi:hypothetical protein